MCGIFGVINFSGQPVDREKVLSARDILAHRGPDDAGVYLSSAGRGQGEGKSFNHSIIQPSVALAHRRLSIIDLSPAAHQPMVSDDGRYVIVFNGEIYNYEELKPLVGGGKSVVGSNKFKTNSDTEVILKLFALEGSSCLNRLRGMFAFAIWDDKEKKLFAARDRFGIKPFYYLHNDNEFIFASELKAIKHYKKGLTLSMQGIDAFLRTGSLPAPLTIYEETKALSPGHWLAIDSHPERSRRISINNYWSFFDLLNNPIIPAKTGIRRDTNYEFQTTCLPDRQGRNDKTSGNDRFQTSWNDRFQTSWNDKRSANDRFQTSWNDKALKYDDQAKKIIRNSLLDTIRAHMVSDVEVGAFLSGGIDSTAIVSLMRQVGQEKIKTISVTFPGHQLDESKYSNAAAKKYSTNHFEYKLQEDELLNDFEKIIETMDQPTIDGINTYFVSKAAASFGLKVVLSGVGGDELFGGYPSFVNIPKYQRIKSLPLAKPLMKAAGFLLNGKLPAKAIEYFNNPDAPDAEYKLIRGLFTDTELRALGWRSDSRRTLFAGMTGRAEMTEAGLPSFRLSSESDGSSSFWQSPESELQHPISGNQNLSPLQYISMLESCFYMRNQLLRDSDVFSMAHSLELRVPFVDHMLYGAVLPYLDRGFDKSFPKKMLVDAVGDLPDEIVHRPKQGFTFPFSDWMKRGKIKEAVYESLSESKTLFNKKALGEMIRKFDEGNVHWSRIWAVFVLSRTIA